jgi:hypothetical protein
MRLFAGFIVVSIFTGCAVPQTAMRTGTVARDGHTILWNEPVQSLAPNPGQFVDTLLRAGSAYCTGYANTYNSQPHGQAMVITPGQGTSFIYY